jgi:hypothetical protein
MLAVFEIMQQFGGFEIMQPPGGFEIMCGHPCFVRKYQNKTIVKKSNNFLEYFIYYLRLKTNMFLHYMTTVHAWNSRLVPLLGFPLNALLFWLIWAKTPKEMRVHSRILLQTCILDIILLIVNFIASPVCQILIFSCNISFDPPFLNHFLFY